MRLGHILLLAGIILTSLTSTTLAQVQSHPLSQLYPMDANLNITGVNITNASYVFFGNNSVDTYLFRSAASVLTLNSHLIASGGWVNSTYLNASTSVNTTTLCLAGICKSTWPSNAVVGGSGTATRVAFWSASDTLSSNANLYWDNDNSRLGIGTTTPSTLLDVRGGINASSLNITGTDNFLNVTNGTRSFLLTNTTHTVLQPGSSTAYYAFGSSGITFTTDNLGSYDMTINSGSTANLRGTSAFVISSAGALSLTPDGTNDVNIAADKLFVEGTNGNVGINTTAPSSLLNVMTHSTDTKVATNISNYGTGNSFVVEDSAADTTPFEVDNAGNVHIGNRLRFNTFTGGLTDVAYASGNDLLIQAASSGAIRFAPAGTELLRLDGSTGNVSIGFGVDTTPDAVLEIGNTSAIRGSWFMVSDSADGDGNIFIIDINKRVGIGTSTPLYALQINNVSMGLNVSNLLFVNNTAVGIGTSTLGAYKLNVIGDINASWVNATNVNVSNSLYGPNFIAASGWGNFSRLNVSDTAYIPTLGMNINVNNFNVSSVNRLGIGTAANQDYHMLVDGHASPFTVTSNTTQTFGIGALHSMTKTTAGNQTANQFSGQFDIKLLEGNTANWTGNFQVLGTSMDLRGDGIGKYWVENAYHLRMDGGSLAAADPNVTNLYGLYVSNMGTVNTTNAYGIYTENFANSGATNKYAIYSAGGNVYLGGNAGIGTTSPGNYKLNVIGDVNASWANVTNLNVTNNAYVSNIHSYNWVNGTNANFSSVYESGSLLSSRYVSRTDWTTIDNYPTGCSAGQSVQTIGDTLTCVSTVAVNNMTGFGIVGYIPQWANGTALNNSNIFQLGSNVGIGTTSPGNYKLNVIGDINASWVNATGIKTPYNQTIIVAEKGGDYTNITSALDSISDSGNFNRYLIKVMPGFYNESVSLCNTDNYVHIQGSGRETTIISSSNSPVVDFCNQAEGVLSDLWIEKTSAGGTTISLSGRQELYNLKVDNAVVNNGGTLINTAGGIPDLRVYNSIIGNYENATAIGMGGDPSTSSIVSNNIIRVSGVGSIGIRSSNVGYTINSSYNVIIGAGIPFQTASSGTIYSRFDHFDGNPVGTNITIIDYSKNTNITAFLVNQSGTGDIAQFYDAANPVLIIKDGGNVGIGTTSPVQKLDVVGSINATSNVTAVDLNATGWMNATAINVDASTLFVDAPNSRVGIGTATPQSLLNIQGTGSLLNVSNSTHSFIFVNETLGRVGIGMADLDRPGTTGILEIDDSVVLRPNKDGKNFGLYMYNTAEGIEWKTGYELALINFFSGTRRLGFFNSNSGATPGNDWLFYGQTDVASGNGPIKMFSKVPLVFMQASTINTTAGDLVLTPASNLIINGTGNVGIGTTSPQSLLHVNSTTANVYLQLSVNNTAIASGDCDNQAEVGRSILGWNVTSSYLYVCSIQGGNTIGWRVLQTLGA